ncbi:MAG: phosphate signaling complex protein PhoU [Armatimonadota bacterium]
MERHLDEEIRNLHKGILKMGASVEDIISKAIESIKMRNQEFSKSIIDSDDEIDTAEVKLEEECIRLLALYQPVAEDLRYIIAVTKIVNDLERMADIAVNITECSIEMANEPLLKPLIDIPKMAELAKSMLKNALNSFISRDLSLAKMIWIQEEEADRLRDLVFEELIGFIEKDGKCVNKALPLLLIARHLERICDLCTNISEDVVYIITGKTIKHQSDIIRKLNNNKTVN